MSTIKGDHYPACATWFGEECDCDAWKEAPVRDIREAMHPPTHGDLMREATIAAGLPPEAAPTLSIVSHEPPFTRPAEPGDAPIAGALIEGAFPWIDPETIAFDPETAKTIERAAHPPQTLLGGPHVATLPDGSRVNLPAGTVLREGEEAIPEHPVIALVRSFVGKPGEGPEVNIEPLPPHLAALLAEHPRWSIADAERSIVDTTEGRDPPK